MDLSTFSEMEEFDLLEAESARMNIEFGREAVKIAALCQDNRRGGNELIEQLRKIYFIGYEDREKSRMEKEVEELIRLTKKTFRIRPAGGSHRLEIS